MHSFTPCVGIYLQQRSLVVCTRLWHQVCPTHHHTLCPIHHSYRPPHDLHESWSLQAVECFLLCILWKYTHILSLNCLLEFALPYLIDTSLLHLGRVCRSWLQWSWLDSSLGWPHSQCTAHRLAILSQCPGQKWLESDPLHLSIIECKISWYHSYSLALWDLSSTWQACMWVSFWSLVIMLTYCPPSKLLNFSYMYK